MLRTTVGVSFLVLFGGLSACSSKATDNGTGGGGNGAVLGGSSGSGSGGIGGSGSGSGGTRTNTAGTTAANAGTAGSTGGTNGLCPDDTITCVDDTQAMGCNPNTGVVETIDCVERYATLGLTSTGCSASAEGEGCDVTDFKDAACLAGAEAYAFCANATDADFVDVYISCFQDFMGSHALVTCLGNYVSATMTTDADCQMAVDVCIDGAGGAGGASGAGGAP
jgi:hypothetical protein